MGLAGSKVSGSCADSNLAVGGASNVRHVKGDDPDEKEYPGPPDLGLGVGLNTKNKYIGGWAWG